MKKLLFLIFACLIWCNIGFAKIFFYSCIHEDQFQMIFKVDDRQKKIIHVSSYNTTAKKKYNVNEQYQVLEWGGDYVWISYTNDDGSRGLSYFDFKENLYLQSTINPSSSLLDYMYQSRSYNCFVSS
jgi:uncharacterized protein YxeA